MLEPFIETEMAAGLLGDGVAQLYWSEEHKQLKYQLGDGCLIDQTLGQWHACLYGLGDILDPAKTSSSLQAIYRHNFKPSLGDIYNPCRVFGLYDEAGTVIADWPRADQKPAVPVPYAQETMHGMEYAFGQMLMQYGMLAEGVRVTAAVRDRYDGAKRNPWNEIECGSNYARSMASWGAVIILSGFTFDSVRGHIGFRPKVRSGETFRSFWSGPPAYGTVEIGEGRAELSLIGGALALASFGLPLAGAEATSVSLNQQPLEFGREGDEITFRALRLNAGDVLAVTAPSLSIATLPDIGTLC